MNFKAVFYLIGRLLCLVALFLLAPMGVSFYYGESYSAFVFLGVSIGTFLIGLFLAVLFKKTKEEGLGIRDGFLLVTLSWLVISLIGALPFYITQAIPSFLNAAFESISGFTTTGASILVNIEALDRGLLFWRALTQWIGGMGIIVLSVAILPHLSVGGLQLVKNEMPGPTFEHLKPRIKQTALSLWKVYFLFSGLAVATLWLAGMPIFDSVCHMFTALGTGGFSTRNASLAAFNPAVQMVITFFMLLAGTNFVLHYAWLHGDFKKVIKNSEWRLYISMMFICFLIITAELFFRAGSSLVDALRLSVFQVVSITSSTGFVTANFDTWPMLTKGLLFLLMIVAGCAGSTGGGFKQIRLLILLKKTKQSITKYIFPKAVVPVKVEKQVVSEDVLTGVGNFFIAYMVIFVLAAFVLMAFGIDHMTSFSAVVASLSNIGPGFGGVGAIENYAFLPGVVKIILCACMIIGRLEIFTVLVLFFPATWKR